jgi:hypothetical protein
MMQSITGKEDGEKNKKKEVRFHGNTGLFLKTQRPPMYDKPLKLLVLQ